MSTLPASFGGLFSASPLLWLAATIGAYALGGWIQRACKGAAWANPVLIAIVLVGLLVVLTGTSYARYFSGAQLLNLLLGPATIALAVPLARNFPLMRQNARGIGLALAAGSLIAILSSMVIVRILGGSQGLALSMAPKSATTPIAMAVSANIGGLPALTAALAILGGIIAAVAGQGLLHRLKITDWQIHGLAAGVAGSGIAAAQVASRDDRAAAFAALGIGLNGLLTACLVPLVIALWP